MGNDEYMFVSYSCPRFDCKLNASLVDLHGPSFVSSILYKSAFMEIQLSDKSQYLNHGAILFRALGGGIRVLGTHISIFFFQRATFLKLPFAYLDDRAIPKIRSPFEGNNTLFKEKLLLISIERTIFK